MPELDKDYFTFKNFFWKVVFGPLMLLVLWWAVTSFLQYVYRMYDWRGEVLFTALIAGLVIVGVNIYMISLLYGRVSKELGEEKNTHRRLLSAIVVLTFAGILSLWVSAGVAPGWLISERTWDIILGSESGKEVKTESEPTYSESEYDNPGTLGDQFGMANALFSGMALAGIILAVLLQTLELKYQRAELRNTRSVFMNSYHLQAMKAVYDSLDDATAINSKKKKAAIQSLEAAIKYMRLAGEIDKYQMDAIREGVRSSLKESEVFEKIAKVSVADSIVNMTNSADECFHLVNDIDQIYPGNGLLEPLLDHVKDLLKKCNHLRNSYVRNDYRSGGLVETPMAEIELGKLDEVRGLCNKSRSEIAELIRDE